MPAEGVLLQTHADILTYEEITSIAKVAIQNGVTKIRLTGGEPLVRRDLPWLIESLARIEGIEDLSLTTNASLLSSNALSMANAGLNRVNISLDTLNPNKFRSITRIGKIDTVWAGILAAEAAGLLPIKINVVVMKGINDDELIDLANLTFEHPWQVRFIELMPFDQDFRELAGDGANDHLFVLVQDMKSMLVGFNLEPITDNSSNGPARIFRPAGAQGTIGFISPLSEHFCGTCNRIRLTADGKLRPCLLNNLEFMIRDPLRSGEDILPLFKQAVDAKPEKHNLNYRPESFNRKMFQIGG